MTTNLRERRRQMLRDEILEATQSLIAERGHSAMSPDKPNTSGARADTTKPTIYSLFPTMEELAARVGVSKPTIYSLFPTKESLLVAMATRVLERLFSVIDDDGASGRSPLDRLSDLLRAGVQSQLERRVTAMQLWMPEMVYILKTYPDTLAQICRIDAMVVDLVRQGMRHGEINPRLSDQNVVRIFYALFMSPNLGPLSMIDSPNSDEMPAALAEFFRRGVGIS
ncbi:MAG: TetR/AcrR family transcriptional regulator [Oscillochloris sp.]|nr:TetR/AcrR family transcriptional regulator [Oscillochloris sp.]